MIFTEESNFAIGAPGFPVEIKGQYWPTIEHAWQASKLYSYDYELVRSAVSLNQARTYGKIRPQMPGWGSERLEILRALNRLKIEQNAAFRLELLKADELIHENQDTFLAQNLGQILNSLREEYAILNRIF
jgi:predicted NAD-dependent protein-ADP-ribosyltransferase YbiA (DUF1768 family)